MRVLSRIVLVLDAQHIVLQTLLIAAVDVPVFPGGAKRSSMKGDDFCMKILISGTPGTGKTSVSEILAEKIGYGLVKINDFAEEKGLVEGVDKVRGSGIIDEVKLEAEVEKLSGDMVVDGHLAHLCKGDMSVVLRTRPDELEKRLLLRKWGKKKIRENVEAEILDVILTEAVEVNENVVEVDTTGKSPEEVCSIIFDMIKKKIYDDFRPGKVSWASYLEDSVI